MIFLLTQDNVLITEDHEFSMNIIYDMKREVRSDLLLFDIGTIIPP